MNAYRQILVIRSDQEENVYGRFAAEILRAEGLMGFEIRDLAVSPLPDLLPGDLAVFTRCFLSRSETSRLTGMIEAGAAVVFIQPQPELMRAWGLCSRSAVLVSGRVRPRTGYPGAGLPLQTHGAVACYDAAGAGLDWHVVADGCGDDGLDAATVAAATATLGRGRIGMFAYDLPRAVARIRFGNPDLVSLVTTGLWRWPHAGDLFTGWPDPALARTVQAEAHGQLLARVLTEICPWPLMRLWYYERIGERTAAVLQSDGDNSKPEEFRALGEALKKRDGSATFYLLKETQLGESDVKALRADGHTFAPHVNPDHGEDLHFAFADALGAETAAFRARFGTCSTSLQCHRAPWTGYVSTMVPAHVACGYRLSFAYLSIPAPSWGTYMCGAGRPLRFCGLDGTVYDCWQQPVPVLDDASLISRYESEMTAMKSEFDALLDGAVRETHTTTAILSHPVSFCAYSRPFMEHAFDRFAAAGVRIRNGDEWCDYTDRRDAVRIAAGRERDGTMVYDPTHVNGRFTVMIPVADGDADAAVTVAGEPTAAERVHRLGAEYLGVEIAGSGPDDGCEVRVVTS